MSSELKEQDLEGKVDAVTKQLKKLEEDLVRNRLELETIAARTSCEDKQDEQR